MCRVEWCLLVEAHIGNTRGFYPDIMAEMVESRSTKLTAASGGVSSVHKEYCVCTLLKNAITQIVFLS